MSSEDWRVNIEESRVHTEETDEKLIKYLSQTSYTTLQRFNKYRWNVKTEPNGLTRMYAERDGYPATCTLEAFKIKEDGTEEKSSLIVLFKDHAPDPSAVIPILEKKWSTNREVLEFKPYASLCQQIDWVFGIGSYKEVDAKLVDGNLEVTKLFSVVENNTERLLKHHTLVFQKSDNLDITVNQIIRGHLKNAKPYDGYRRRYGPDQLRVW